MAKQKHILIIRLSALGDVAIAAPLVREYALENPSIKFTMVSQGFVEPMFTGIKNLNFFAINIKKEGGIAGLYKAAKSISKLKPTHIADMHGVHRSRILRTFLRLRGIPSYSINKNRLAKRALTKANNKDMSPLPTSQRLYEEVLIKIGLKDLRFASTDTIITKDARSIFFDFKSDDEFIEQISKSKQFKIGIAPFAKHIGKCWPLDSMEEVIAELSMDSNNMIMLFGGGIEEEKILMGLEQKYTNTYSLAGKYKLGEELKIMSHLDLMISMDSANMHLASFVRTPVISIWGATHPNAGFYGWGQDKNNALQVEMSCRPCSIYGNRACRKGDYPCLKAVSPTMVVDSVKRLEASFANKK